MKLLFLAVALSVGLSLNAQVKIVAFSGSTRRDSCNTKLLNEAAAIARSLGAEVQIVDLREYSIPFYDGDLEEEQGMPANAKRFRELLKKSDAVMIASPEYNASVSAVLKNALDWASRSEEGEDGSDILEGKKVALMSASPGSRGGKRGLVHLRAIIEELGGQVVPEQISLPGAYKAFSPEGKLLRTEVRLDLEKEIKILLESV